jgi:phosphoglycerate kinase
MIRYLKPDTLKNKTVFLRVDFNVPLENGRVTDTFRIEQSLPTLKMLYRGGNKLVIGAHLGRPEGQWEEKLSLRPVAKELADMLGMKFVSTDRKIPEYHIPHIIFYEGDIRTKEHQKQILSVNKKDIVILENLRFYPEEESNSMGLAKNLAALADVYVNDSFGVDHRKGASITGVPKLLPRFAGYLLENEIKGLTALVKHHKSPFVLMMGGIKISDKVETIVNLGAKADKILLSGGIANLFFHVKGLEVGKSKIEPEGAKVARELSRNFKDRIVLPYDVVVANEKMDTSTIRVCQPFEVRKNEIILDAGPKTILAFAEEIKKAKTILWNGPLGYFEKKPFDTATMALAHLIGGRGKGKAFVVAGGGETVDAIRLAQQFKHIDHVSTGGGAMLEFLAGKKLPGIEALK